jgi:uncharacterized protein
MYRSVVFLKIKVIPRSSVNKLEIHSYKDGLVIGKIKIMVPPVDGKANSAVIKYLSDLLDIPKYKITIHYGITSKNKTIKITDVDDDKFSRLVDQLTLL